MKLNWASSSKRYSDEKPSTYVWHNQVLSWRLPKIKNKQISGRAADEILCREGIMSLHVIECMERRNNRMEKKSTTEISRVLFSLLCLTLLRNDNVFLFFKRPQWLYNTPFLANEFIFVSCTLSLVMRQFALEKRSQ